MRHRIKGRKLGRSTSHRLATLRALATALFRYKKIKTTVAKAKEAKRMVERLITKAKADNVAARRYVARHIHEREVLHILFDEIVGKVGDRPGGYCRVVKLGHRPGDAAEMAILELVDYNLADGDQKAEKVEEAVVEETPAETVENAEVVDAVEVEETEEVKDEAKADDAEVKTEDEAKAEEEKKEDK